MTAPELQKLPNITSYASAREFWGQWVGGVVFDQQLDDPMGYVKSELTSRYKAGVLAGYMAQHALDNALSSAITQERLGALQESVSKTS